MASKADTPCANTCGRLIIGRESKTGYCSLCYRIKRRDAAGSIVPTGLPVPAQIDLDLAVKRLREQLAFTQKKYEGALAQLETQATALGAVEVMRSNVETFRIVPKLAKQKGEGTVIAAVSDWHLEETVGAEVGGLNVYNLDIAKARVTRYFRGLLRLTDLHARDIKIDTIVLALLGDFITNDIHGAETAEANGIGPTHAIITAQNWLISGIDFLLANSPYTLVVPCHSGNHARTTITTRFTSENAHSLEYLMYRHLEAYYRNEPRITFIVAPGMHSYVSVYDKVIRFHHGHAVKYGGGVGGIYIPVNKAIAQWNKARHADLDIFGHFHQLRDGGNFICNGSLIGYNAFAQSIKADYEEPQQAMVLIDKKRGRTCAWQIKVKE